MIVLRETEKTRPIKLWTDPATVEEAASQQLKNVAALTHVVAEEGIAVMPDVHYGKGATVGSVIPTINAIIPAAVGVDIGCGMEALRLPFDANALDGMLPTLREEIEKFTPVGFSVHGHEYAHLLTAWEKLFPGYEKMIETNPKVEPNHHPIFQIGTLGGGNHFIEICVDQDDSVWIMLHSGSRGVGNLIGRHYISRAQELMIQFGIPLRDTDLAYLRNDSDAYGNLFQEYCDAVLWAQSYASQNRKAMMTQVLDAFRSAYGTHRWNYLRSGLDYSSYVSCHHNYVSFENHFGRDMVITRKGAVSAKEGEMVIIPGSMGARSYIARGKGNPDSYNSCSHGAGRRMSRGAAKRTFTVADLEKQTAGVECRKDDGVLDEIPGAYKNIDEVMAYQADLVEPVYTLKQLICIKG